MPDALCSAEVCRVLILISAIALPLYALVFVLGYALGARKFRAQDERFAEHADRLRVVEGLTGAILMNARRRVMAKRS